MQVVDIDTSSAQKADYRLRKLLWAFASANNCLNPVLYRMVGHSRSVNFQSNAVLKPKLINWTISSVYSKFDCSLMMRT